MFDTQVRKALPNYFGNLAQGKIEFCIADIEDLAAYQPDRSFQDLHDRIREVADMDEGSPLLPVVNRDDTLLAGLGREEVYYEIEAGPITEAENGGEAEDGRMESVRDRIEKGALGIDLGLPVKR